DRAPQELGLPAWLALEVQDLLTRVAHMDQRFLLIVLQHALVIACGDAEREPSRSAFRRIELHAHRCRLTRAGQRYFLGPDDATTVLDQHRHLLSAVARL